MVWHVYIRGDLWRPKSKYGELVRDDWVYAGARSSVTGAESLAEKELGRTIYGWYQVSPGKLVVPNPREAEARVEHDHPALRRKRGDVV